MAEVKEHTPDTFCWVDLATTDIDKAKQFYTQLFAREQIGVSPVHEQAGVSSAPEQAGETPALPARETENRAVLGGEIQPAASRCQAVEDRLRVELEVGQLLTVGG